MRRTRRRLCLPMPAPAVASLPAWRGGGEREAARLQQKAEEAEVEEEALEKFGSVDVETRIGFIENSE